MEDNKFLIIMIIALVTISVFTTMSIVSYLLEMDHNVKEVRNEIKDISYDIMHIRGSIQCDNVSIDSIVTTGRYYFPSDTIKIYIKGRDFKRVSRTFVHEWGHHVFYEDLKKEQREEFCNLNCTKYVSEYAKTNCDENFAETYLYLSLNLSEIPEPQKSWFRENVEKLK